MRFRIVLVVAFLSLSSAPAAEVVVEDIFGRRLNEPGLVLVDWDGPMANPAIKVLIVPPADAVFPARAVLTASEPRIYFDLPSDIGARGPRKVVEFAKREKRPVFVSIFSGAQEKDQDYALQLDFQDASGKKQAVRLPCHVLAQGEKAGKRFPITVDFSQDRTGFFKDEKNQKVITQAAQDWAYFLEPVPLDPVPAGKEKTFIWGPDGFKKGQFVVNDKEYTGYLLYAYGIQSGELRSGGEPSREGGLLSQRGKAIPLHRSGGVEIETQGNYNTKRWMVSLAEGDYWKATNLGDVPNDLYSIAHHEIGHALIFNPANPRFATAKTSGKFDDPAIREYLAADLTIDKADHLAGAVDPVSRRGAFGNEYHGLMPQCRWQITKLDLLCARAVGYTLRDVAALAPLQLQTEALPHGVVGKDYKVSLRVTGGVPFYNWEITAGSLPDGLKLDSLGGTIRGVPTRAGTFEITLRVRDYDEHAPGQSRKLRLEIGPR